MSGQHIPTPDVIEGLPVVINGTVPMSPGGTLVVAKISCQPLNIEGAYLVVDPTTDRIALMSTCGCLVHHKLSDLVLGLGRVINESHPNQTPEALRAACH